MLCERMDDEASHLEKSAICLVMSTGAQLVLR